MYLSLGTSKQVEVNRGCMELVIKNGNIFEDTSQALVNPVNCIGVAGKGLALDFAVVFADNYQYYKRICTAKLLRPGVCLPFFVEGQYIINFPTKDHFMHPSKLEYIELGLDSLYRQILALHIKSIAIPALGCGLGGLDWNVVKGMITRSLNDLDLLVHLYEPIKK